MKKFLNSKYSNWDVTFSFMLQLPLSELDLTPTTLRMRTDHVELITLYPYSAYNFIMTSRCNLEAGRTQKSHKLVT